VIELRKVTKQYALGKVTVHALRGVTLDISAGEFVCVAGPSGSGKSTLLNLIGLLDRPTSGTITVNGVRVDELGSTRRALFRRQHIGFIFQHFNLLPVLNVYENVEFPLLVAGRATREMRRRVDELIEAVGLKEFVRHRPDELSGGQRQRVAIARALVLEPTLVLADEPTASLDSHTALQIIEVMTKLNREKGITFLFSTHDERVMRRASRLLMLRDGTIEGDQARLAGEGG